MPENFDVVIVGGGVVGLTLANLLTAVEYPEMAVAVIDAGPPPDAQLAEKHSLRVSAISPQSRLALKQCGVWQSIAALRTCEFRSMCVWDAQSRWDSQDAVRFDAAELDTEVLGFIVENELIRRTLFDSLTARGIVTRTDTRVQELVTGPRETEIVLADGKSIATRLVVAADGAQSRVRKLSGIHSRHWDYNQRAFVTHVTSELGHEATAWQRFTPAGPFALLPLDDGRSSIVYSTSAHEATALIDMDIELAGTELTRLSDGVLGALKVDAARGAFPLAGAHAHRYTTERCALIGDAAHRIHPLAGQGVNLGISDALALSLTIGQAVTSGRDPGDKVELRAYERARRASNELTLRTMNNLNRLFTTQATPVAKLRRVGMAIFNRTQPLKREAARQAMGLKQL